MVVASKYKPPHTETLPLVISETERVNNEPELSELPPLHPELFEDPKDLNPTGMYMRIETITPLRAQKALDTQINPRKPSERKLKAYCEDRRNGRWTLTHQGIAFDCKNRLRDGQHRLHMVVRTGLPTVFVVFYNVPEESLVNVDEQMPRSVRVALKAAGLGDYTDGAIAVARVIQFMPHQSNRFLTRNDYLTLLRDYGPALTFAEEHCRARGLTAAVRCLVARAWYTANTNRLAEWCSVICTGMTVSDKAIEDAAAIRYRNVLIDLMGNTGHIAEMDRYRKGQVALQKFLNREDVGKRIYGTEKDLFPLPVPQPTK